MAVAIISQHDGQGCRAIVQTRFVWTIQHHELVGVLKTLIWVSRVEGGAGVGGDMLFPERNGVMA